ncbi:hypothetical protein [Marinobacter sp. F4206]|uniref:hypothetical protein n=1 Tax=Marinobacter sp. F4206 TaxID=2861777 RepID=UPI001C5D2B10|nr:hypothetical protein [Marinobacter sp. F4206]MBW4936626.1 hypothetical protein [Marinobacter sp. F4206]
MKMLTACSVVLSAMLMTSIAQAACSFEFQEIRQDNRRPYSSFHPGVNVLDLMVSTRQTSCEQLTFSFESANDGTLAGANGKIQYRLKDQSGRNLETRGASRVSGKEVLSRRLGSSLILQAFLDPGSFVPPGVYLDNLSITAFSNGEAVAQVEADLFLEVRPEANISLTGSSSGGFSSRAGGSLNFGRLKEGKERFAFLFVRSNVDYGLTVSSENNGYLVHRSESGPDGRISYSAWLDQALLDLTSRSTIRRADMTPAFRSRPHKLTARINEVKGKLAGDYQDVILVEVVFLE